MKILLSAFVLFSISTVFSQEIKPVSPIIEVDSLYREDQFYLGLTYNTLVNRPTGIAQKKFSSGVSFGFLRDMPINKRRTVAIATGLGFSFNKSNQNLLIKESNNIRTYSVMDSDLDYSKNKLTQYYVDVPLELRWRTSTPESHKFWRIYSGIKMSYLILDKYTHLDTKSNYTITNNDDLNRLQFGTYIAFGYNTWNFSAYYGFTPFFKSSIQINNQPLDLKTLNLGLMFYIL